MGLRERGEVGIYSGRREGWTLRPPYLASLRMRLGTKRPMETAMMRFMGPWLVMGS